MSRRWALSEKGQELVNVIMSAGITDEEFAIRLAEHMAPAEELYPIIDQEKPHERRSDEFVD